MKTKDLSICAVSLGLLVIGSKISIPLSFIPLTLQTLVVILLGFVLHKKQVLFTFGVYMLAGLCGLPIFANGGGIAYVLQPSFGFILSFPIAAYLIASLRFFYQDNILKMIITGIFGLLVIYCIGAIYMYGIFAFVLVLNKSVWDVLMLGVIPFIINDSISCCIACIIAKRLYVPLQNIKTTHTNSLLKGN